MLQPSDRIRCSLSVSSNRRHLAEKSYHQVVQRAPVSSTNRSQFIWVCADAHSARVLWGGGGLGYGGKGRRCTPATPKRRRPCDWERQNRANLTQLAAKRRTLATEGDGVCKEDPFHLLSLPFFSTALQPRCAAEIKQAEDSFESNVLRIKRRPRYVKIEYYWDALHVFQRLLLSTPPYQPLHSTTSPKTGENRSPNNANRRLLSKIRNDINHELYG